MHSRLDETYEGQLTSNTWTGNATAFSYDALGRRHSRTAGGVTTVFYRQVEKQGSTTTATYTVGNGLIRKDTETPLFDGLGSERTVTNTAGTVTGTVNYDAFGQVLGTTGSSSNPFMFAAQSGYRNDNDAGLLYVGARYYDPQVGRFITPDTYLDQNPYLYCEHDPVNNLDPSGHETNPKEILHSMAKTVGTGLGGLIGAAITAPETGGTASPAGAILGSIIGAGISEWLWQQFTTPIKNNPFIEGTPFYIPPYRLLTPPGKWHEA